MRRVGRVALWTVAAVTVVLAACVGILVATFDPEAAFVRQAARIHQLTGRELAARDVRVRWSVPPVLVVDGLTLSNAPGASRPAMAQAASVEVQPRLLALLSGELLLDVRLFGPDILIENGNWQWRPVPAPVASGATSPVQRPRLQPEIAALTILDARLAVADGSGVQMLVLPRLRATRGTDGAYAGDGVLRVGDGEAPVQFGIAAPRDGPVRVTAAAQYRGGNGAFSLDLDRWPASPDQPVSFVGEASTSSGVSATLKGSIAQPLALRGLDAQGKLTVASLADATSSFGWNVPPLRDVEVQTRLLDPAGLQSGIALRSFRLTSQQGNVSGDVAIKWSGRPTIRGTLTSTRFDLEALRVRPIDDPATPGPAPALPLAPAPTREIHVIPDIPLAFAPLRRVDADIALSAVNLAWGDRSLPRAEGRILLHEGRLTVDPVSVLTEGGALAGAVTVDLTTEPAHVALNIHGDGLRLDRLTNLVHGSIDIDVALAASGEGTRALAATLDGHVGIALVDGDVANEAIESLIEPIRTDRISVRIPGRTAVRCLAVRLDSTAGTITANQLVLDTPRTGLEGHGTANLADERLALQVRLTARLYAASLTTQVDVTGPLTHPVKHYGALGGASQSEFDCAPSLLAARGRPGPTPAATQAGGLSSDPFDAIRRQLQQR